MCLDIVPLGDVRFGEKSSTGNEGQQSCSTIDHLNIPIHKRRSTNSQSDETRSTIVAGAFFAILHP